ncbi:MAG: hypothetical protein Sapg2KO_10200 [Saprospiraceae bacterium]
MDKPSSKNRRIKLSIVLFLLICSFAKGQKGPTDWYSETEYNGLIIQNSFPKGGLYQGPTKEKYHPSYLVFFSRVINETGKPVELDLNFSADSIAIPNSPNTFMKLFLPSDTMTLDKRSSFSYGLTELEGFDESTSFQRKLNPNEECLFYVVAFFYQPEAGAWVQERGGNRAELFIKGQDLFYRMLPQVDYLDCGKIMFNE